MDNVRPHQRKILRSPSVKRKSKVLPVNQRVQLERVLGVTVSSNSGLSCDSNNGTIAYPAGCVTVLFNPRRNRQSHIFNSCKKTITAVAFSPDGKYLVTGETGHQPAVRVWDVAEKVQVAEFHGHRFGISCVAFSPNQKEVVSVGTQHDMMVNVWNWKTNSKIASNKISSKVSAVAFSEDGSCFITVGNRLVKFWYLERSKINQTVPLRGRSGILQEHKDNFFCDVVAGTGPMGGHFFVITQSGLLCEFNEKRQLDKWVELRTKSANCIAAGAEHIFVGCAEGVVRVFNAHSLYYLCSLPKPHHLGVEVTTATSPSSMVSNREGVKFPDTMAIAMDDDHKKVTCVYNDRSVYIWDVHDLKKVGKAWSFLYHSGCIWALEVYPPLEDGTKGCLPPGSFLTASGDDTIRVWNLNTHMPEDTAYRRNIYSNELLKIVYADPTLTNLCTVDYNPAGAADKTDTNYDGKNGVRSIRVSPDGADLASGDRQGNIRIYDMEYLNEKRSIEAHESDVMCLEYSYTNTGKLLATASRDRLIHVFDVEENYGLIQTLGDHSSSISAVRFTDNDKKLRMISCGADKSILIRTAGDSADSQFQLEQHLATKITLYDMVIDPTQKVLATACQDRNVRQYNIQTTKEKKCYRGSMGDEGILLRIHLDPSGSLAATSCTDKNVCLLDFQTGELLATMQGHSEVITGVRFANDLKHVITVSADGCIFVWRLPSEMTAQIKGRLIDLGKKMKDTDFIKSDLPLMPNPVDLGGPQSEGNFPVLRTNRTFNLTGPDDDSVDGREDNEDDDDEGSKSGFDDTASQISLDYRFSTGGPLPNWAKAKNSAASQSLGEMSSDANEEAQHQPKGRWAQRVDRTAEFKSQLDLTQDEDAFSDRRRASEARQLADLRRETVVLGRQLGDKNLPVIGDDQRASRDGVSALNSKGRRESSPGGLAKRWSERFEFKSSLELDDTDDHDTGSDTTEVIYPPTDGDSDPFASSYKIFGIGDNQKARSKSSIGNVSNIDDASESTDPISLEEEEDTNDESGVASNPTTPSDPDKLFLSKSPNKEDFVRENFEEDSFTPIPMEKFTKSLDKLERQKLEGGPPASTPFSPRLSLSARFMSRSQQSAFKGVSSLSGNLRTDNWFSMNLRSESREEDSPEREDPPSPPTRLDTEDMTFPELPKGPLATTPPSVFVSPPWAQSSNKHLRRLWSTFSLSNDIIKEEVFYARTGSFLGRSFPPPSYNHECLLRPSLQPRPPLYHSRIPTPCHSPRPPRLRKGEASCFHFLFRRSISNSLSSEGSSCSSQNPSASLGEGSCGPPSQSKNPSRGNSSQHKNGRTRAFSESKPSSSSASNGKTPSKSPRSSSAGPRGQKKQPGERSSSQSPSVVKPCHRKSCQGASPDSRLSQSPKSTPQKSRAHSLGGSTAAAASSRSRAAPPPIISSQATRRIHQDRERRRSTTAASSSQEPEERPPSEASSQSSSDTSMGRPPPPQRSRPTYFKTTQSSRGKVMRGLESGRTEPTQPVSEVNNLSKDYQKKKARRSAGARLPGTKLSLYASTPNLFDGEEEEVEAKPKKSSIKFTSTTNLRMLSDLSRSVPDVNEGEAGAASTGPDKQAVRKANTGWVPPKLVRDQQLMPPPVAPAARGTSADRKEGPGRRKSSSSEMTLDQAKSILLGNSGILGKGSADPGQQTNSSGQEPSSSRSSQRDSAISLSTTSTLTPESSPTLFESSLPSQKQLAYEQEIEQAASLLRHQATFSPEHLRDSVPLDPPERDGSSPNARRVLHHKAGRQSSPHAPFHSLASASPAPSGSNTYHLNNGGEASSHSADGNSDSVTIQEEEEELQPQSVKDRIAQYARKEKFSESPGVGSPAVRSSSPFRRSLPQSPSVRESPHSHSDTGLGSESDTDRSTHVNTGTGPVRNSDGPCNSSPQANRSKLALPVTPSPGNTEVVTVAQCQTLVAEFKSQLCKLAQVLAQVQGQPGEGSQQMLQLLAQAVQEGQTTLSDLSSSTAPAAPQLKNGDSQLHTSHLLSSSSSLLEMAPSSTFQSQAVNGSQDKTCQEQGDDNVKAEEKSPRTSSLPFDSQPDILEAAKDMLQPLVAQLSQDLSQEIVSLVRERLASQSS